MSENERRVTINAKIELMKKKLVYFRGRRLRTKKELIRIVKTDFSTYGLGPSLDLQRSD